MDWRNLLEDATRKLNDREFQVTLAITNTLLSAKTPEFFSSPDQNNAEACFRVFNQVVAVVMEKRAQLPSVVW
jgi:hypothetical protein